MQNVIDHPYITKPDEAYEKGYEEWKVNQIKDLELIKKKHAE